MRRPETKLKLAFPNKDLGLFLRGKGKERLYVFINSKSRGVN